MLSNTSTPSGLNSLIKNEKGWMDSSLSASIVKAFVNPSDESEAAVRSLWWKNTTQKVPPKGVYATQLLSPKGITYIRYLFDQAAASGIPTRRPNGMNRHGVIVDRDVYGAVPVHPLVTLVEEIIDRIVRPVGRMLFQDRIGCDDDLDYYAFTIQYDGAENEDVDDVCSTFCTQQSKDVDLKEHRDASVVTMNINLNLPTEDYGGSEVFFRGYPDADGGSRSTNPFEVANHDKDDFGTVVFTPGMAIIHLGAHRHGSLPISSISIQNANSENLEGGPIVGKRFNLVIWLFGINGDVRIGPYSHNEQLTAAQRWQGCR
jgi:hypothetical protein